MKKYCLLLIFFFTFLFSCKEQKEQSDFFFQIPELDLGVTTSKRIGAKFYVMFSKDSVGLSENVDYLRYKTSDMSNVNLIFDPENKKNIYIRETEYLKGINSITYNLHIIEKQKFDSLFFEKKINEKFLALKYPFIYTSMYPSTYGIYIEKEEANFKWIKEGDILGGW